MPPGIWQHVFAAQQRLPLLRTLNIYQEASWPDAQPITGPFDGADVGRLASCCPELCKLGLSVTVHPGLSNLQRLQKLTSLDVTFPPAVVLEDFMSDVAALTGLQELSLDLHGTWSLWEDDIWQLTVLVQLTRLQLDHNTQFVNKVC